MARLCISIYSKPTVCALNWAVYEFVHMTWSQPSPEILTCIPPSLCGRKQQWRWYYTEGPPKQHQQCCQNGCWRKISLSLTERTTFRSSVVVLLFKCFTVQELAGEVSRSSETGLHGYILRFPLSSPDDGGPVCWNIYQKPWALACSSSQLNEAAI